MSVQFVPDIFRGAYFLDSEHYELIGDKFIQNVKANKLKNVKKAYEKAGDNYLKRIEVFEKYFEWQSIPIKYLERFQKSVEYSSAFREVGNRAYKAKDISNAFRGYNLALAFAPTGTEQEGLAYANRSALFIFINEYHKALGDLKLATSFKLNEDVYQKLLVRREKCEEEVKLEQDGFFDQEGKEFCAEKILKLKSPSEEIKGAEDFVRIEYSAECGRRLVASRDVSAGTTVLVDKGFTKILDKFLNWDTEHCAFCTKPILGGIPNPFTTFGMYCNETCLKTALDSISKYEHNYLPYIHCTEPLHDESLLIFRILIKVGAEKLHKLMSDGTLTNTEGKIAGFNQNGIYDSEFYQSVYNLVAHRSPLDFDNLKTSNEFKSIFLTHLLQESTNFFQESTKSQDPNFKTFVASLILRHYENIEYNVLSLSEWRTVSGPLSQPLWKAQAKLKSQNAKTGPCGTGVFPLVAMSNHSCDPNTMFVKGTKVDSSALVTSKRIRAGEEIQISYKAPFTRMALKDRQEYLIQNYKFVCGCFACKNKFSIDSTVEEPVLVGRGGCGGDSCSCESIGSQCGNCELKMSRLIEVGMRLELAQQFVREEEFIRAFQLLVEQADFLSNFQTNFKMVQVCQDLFRRVVVHIIHL